MAERVVVAFRSRRVTTRGEPDEAHLETMRTLSKRATARGGRIVAWAATVIAFDFALDDVEDAMDLVAEQGSEAPVPEQFSAGVAQGELEVFLEPEGGSHISLCWGVALVKAMNLSRVARRGEVLVDPAFEAVRIGDLLTLGSRMGQIGSDRVRGLRLDTQHPWRAALLESVVELTDPAMAGRAELLAEAMVPAGSLGVVRAARGAGGSRFLSELARELEPARILTLTPHPVGEPLGALRRSLERERVAARAPTVLTGGSSDALERLAEGRGFDLDVGAALVVEWLKPSSGGDASGAVLIDDAAEVDRDTLEVIAEAAARGAEPFRVIARLGPHDELPDPLSELPEGPELVLPTLSRAAAADVAKGCVRGEIDDAAATRWGKRGGGAPLAIIEALTESLENGELVWADGRAVPRGRRAGRGRAEPARHWILKRLGTLDAASRAVVLGVAVLGGQATEKDLTGLMNKVANVPVDVTSVIELLRRRRWINTMKPELVELPSSTHRDAIVATLAGPHLAEWQRAAGMVMETSELPLGFASAAYFCALGGDLRRACRLARQAADAARTAGLIATASALESFAKSERLSALTTRGLSGSIVPGGSVAPAAASLSVMPPDGWSIPSTQRSSYPPVELPPGVGSDPLRPIVPRAPKTPSSDLLDLAGDAPDEPEPPISEKVESSAIREVGESAPPASFEELGAAEIESSKPQVPEDTVEELDSSAFASVEPEALPESDASEVEPRRSVAPVARPAEEIAALEEIDDDDIVVSEPPPAAQPEFEPLELDDEPVVAARASGNGAGERKANGAPKPENIPEASAALRGGDAAKMKEVAAKLREEGRLPALADRLDAIASLADGQSGEALRVLRAAVQEARETKSPRITRAALAHGVALAAAGRTTEAVLEVLDGLARARETSDTRGEIACASFLVQLAKKSGQSEAANAWAVLIRK